MSIATRPVPANMADRLILALDVPTVARAREIVAELEGIVRFYKIGMWLLFQRETDAFIDELLARGHQIFLDYKMYDIGETVRRGVEAAARRGISFVTIHGDAEIIKAAVQGRGGSALKLLAISVLTSLDDAALAGMGYRLSARELVELRVRTAVACGCDGVIASAHDDPDHLRRVAGAQSLLIATPGIRLASGRTDDHRRVADPASAIRRGADYLVVGRPILEARDKAGQALAIIGEMERGAASG